MSSRFKWRLSPFPSRVAYGELLQIRKSNRRYSPFQRREGRMRADARRNYEHIVEVARVVFTEEGVEVPLDDITKRANVGAGTLYRHFPTREALIEAVFRTEMPEM